jgi:hypothetical protein
MSTIFRLSGNNIDRALPGRADDASVSRDAVHRPLSPPRRHPDVRGPKCVVAARQWRDFRPAGRFPGRRVPERQLPHRPRRRRLPPVLRFGRAVARRFAEKRLHTNQVLEPQAHPTPIARMHIVVSECASPGTRVQFPPPPLFLNMRLQATVGVTRRLNSLMTRKSRRPPTRAISAK